MKRIFYNNRGIALIVVILMVSVIVGLTVELNRATRDELYSAANLSDGIRLYYIAKSGFYGGEALLIEDSNNFDALTEDWAKMELFSQQSESYFRQGSFLVRIEDETGKIPINKLISGKDYNIQVKGLLERLLSLPEFELEQGKVNEIIDSIKDWLDGRAEQMDEYRRTEGKDLADVNWYRKIPGLSAINMSYGLLGVKSSYFTVISMGILGKMKETVTGTVKKGQERGAAELLSWNVE